MKRKIKIFTSFFIVIVAVATLVECVENKKPDYFVSNFTDIEKRTWIGPEYWANPLQDWQVDNDRIECLVANELRNIHHLTRQLGNQSGTLEMQVTLGLLGKNKHKENSWVGFCIGAQGEFDDYRNHAVFGKGLDVGVGTNGALFIEQTNRNNSNNSVMQALQNSVDLKVTLAPENGSYTIKLSLLDSDTGKLLSQISKKQIAAEKLIGDLVLVSHFASESTERNYQKSVWFKDWSIKGTKVVKKDKQHYGPILFSQYTMSRKKVKLTAQMVPVDHPTKKVSLEIKEQGNWKKISEAPIDKDARTATFVLENWNDTKDIQYRLVYNLEIADKKTKDCYWEGTFRKNPIDKEELVIAGFTGNNDLGFPNSDIFNEVQYQNPDVLFFSGDQIYEEVGGYYIQLEPLAPSKLDYLRKWYLFGWAYRDLLKDRPTVCITDDHDVYMGNIWGEGGRKTLINTGHRKHIQDSGGYRMPAEWVKMVERTQTSHLPDPYDPTPVKQGIGVYYTSMNYGKVSFAILEDRKFKSAPKALLPKAGIVNGWPENKKFNIEKYGDVPGAKLLGERQLTFLEDWASDWSAGAEMKIVLSQTIFANVATLPKAALSDVVVPTLRIVKKGDCPPDDQPVGDLDSNGWPQTGRNKAVKTIRKGFAFHLAGDQHLGSTIQYGVDNWNDSGYAFCVPSISNYWPRRWYPQTPGKNRATKAPKYTGDFKDGFGNKFTVQAISNPLYTGLKPAKLYDRAAGYGLVKMHKQTRDIVLECWPRGSKPSEGDTEQYDGWPITVNQLDNFGKNAKAYLPTIHVTGMSKPVLQIIDELENEIVYTLRLKDTSFQPKVLKNGKYTIVVSDPDTDQKQLIKHNVASQNNTKELHIKF